MKKIICIISSLIIVSVSFFVCLYSYTLNYDYQKDYTSFQDVVSGYPKGATTIGNYEKDYYTMLDSCTYSCLNFFEASSMLLTSGNVQTITFASSKKFNSEKYDATFALAEVILRNDGAYILVTQKPDGRISHSVYSINNEDLTDHINTDDLEDQNISSEIIQDCFSSISLFLRKYGIAFAIILVISISSVFLISKQKKSVRK